MTQGRPHGRLPAALTGQAPHRTHARPMHQAWMSSIAGLVACQPRPGHNLTRLYRIEPQKREPRPEWLAQMLLANGASQAENRWFTDDPTTLAPYAILVAALSTPMLAILDVPSMEIEEFRADRCAAMLAGRRPQAFSRCPEHDFFLPENLARGRRRVGAVPEPRQQAAAGKHGQASTRA